MLILTAMMPIFLKGCLIGLSVAAPVGPVALMCIRTTLTYGRRAGFASGAGAALADALFATIGILGVVFVLDFIKEYSVLIRLAGGAFLVSFGIMTMRSTPKEETNGQGARRLGPGLLKDFFVTFLVMLTNPGTLLAFIAVFAVFNIETGGNMAKTSVVVAGVLSGSLTWWACLIMATSILKKKLTNEIIHKINLTSGFVIMLFGVGIFLLAVAGDFFGFTEHLQL
ncbi:MAG: LysE family transporter [Alphaproteobacteria bacterium]